MGAEENKLQIVSSRVLQILCMFFFIVTFWYGISFFIHTYGMHLAYILLFFVILFMLIIMAFLINRYVTSKQFLVILFLVPFSLRLVWILNVHTPIISDFLMMYQSAIDAAKGDFGFGENNYFSNWVYQLGFTMYEALIIKIFGEGTFVLKLLNVLFSVGTTMLVYKIAAKVFNDECGRIAGIIYAIYLPSIVMSSVLTNQHLATFLFYLGFYVLINHDHSKIGLCVGILLSLGDIIRPLGSFILLAVGLFLFITQFLGRERKQKITTVKHFTGIFVTFFLVHFIISQLFISMGVTKYPLENRDTLWKFVVGLNYETTGGYSVKDNEYVWNFPIGSDRKEAEMQLIKERVADKQKLMVLFNNKFKKMWADKDASISWSLKHIHQKRLINSIYIWERLIYISLMFFGIISLMKLVKDKSSSNVSLLFFLLIIGYVAVHFLIEVQTRYRYFIMPSFVILQSYGLYSLVVYLNGYYKHFFKKNINAWK